MSEEVKEVKKERIPKQVIVIRKDLGMPTGKIAVQASHASTEAIFSMMYTSGEQEVALKMPDDSAIKTWRTNGLSTKICVTVNSEEELVKVYRKALEKKLPASLIRDAGLTVFNGVPTLTCCGIGPAWSDELDEITGKLQLLRG